jgi:putative mRNA 3-end processing factor
LEGLLRLREHGLCLDARRPMALSFVSHAHRDHMAAHARMLCTPVTADLLAAQGWSAAAQPLEVLRPIQLGPYRLELLPAGHISGAAQLLVTAGAHRTIYTGDLGPLAGSVVAGRPMLTECDELIIDATYGHPRHRYEDPAVAVSQLLDRVVAARKRGEVVVVLANPVGRAQEVIHALLDAGLPVNAPPRLVALSRACGGLAALDAARLRPFRGSPPDSGVCVYPIQARARTLAWKNVFRIAVTGMLSPGTPATLGVQDVVGLTDHADFDDLLQLVEESGARRVWTAFTHAGPLAAALTERGVTAAPLVDPPQLPLFPSS